MYCNISNLISQGAQRRITYVTTKILKNTRSIAVHTLLALALYLGKKRRRINFIRSAYPLYWSVVVTLHINKKDLAS